MSYEDEVMLSPRYLREHRIDLYAGPASSASTCEAWELCCESTQEEDRVSANSAGGESHQESEYVGGGVVQEHDSHGATRGVGLRREFIREGAPWHCVLGRLAGVRQGGVSLVISRI